MPATTARARKKLVIVEDDDETRDLESFLLTSEGYDVIGLPDGELAAQTVKREAADLVLLDLMLPHRDGLEVLRDLGADPSTATTPVIVVSAYVDRTQFRAPLGASSQVRAVLLKPFEIVDLLDAVSRALGSAS